MGKNVKVHSRRIRRSKKTRKNSKKTRRIKKTKKTKKTKKRMRGGAKSALRVHGPGPEADPKDLTDPTKMNSDYAIERARGKWRGHTEPTIDRDEYKRSGWIEKAASDKMEGEESVTERTGRKSVVTHGPTTYIPLYGSTMVPNRAKHILENAIPHAGISVRAMTTEQIEAERVAHDSREFLRRFQIESGEASKEDPTNLNVPPDCPCPEDYPKCIGVGEGYFKDGGWCYKEEIDSSGQSNKIFNNRGWGECGSRFGHNCTHSYREQRGPELQIATGKALAGYVPE